MHTHSHHTSEPGIDHDARVLALTANHAAGRCEMAETSNLAAWVAAQTTSSHALTAHQDTPVSQALRTHALTAHQ